MEIAEAQRDIRRAYVGGGPGAIISGILWLVAAWFEQRQGVQMGFTVLFVGGMLIFPLSKLVAAGLFRRAGEAKGNGLSLVALESTVAMIGCLFAGWLLLPVRPELVFPVAAIAVGTHYAAFRTAYGDRTYWVLAAAITAAGVAAVYGKLPIGGVALWVGGLELVFGLLLTVRGMRVRDA